MAHKVGAYTFVSVAQMDESTGVRSTAAIGISILPKDKRHKVSLNSQPCVYKGSALTTVLWLPSSLSNL